MVNRLLSKVQLQRKLGRLYPDKKGQISSMCKVELVDLWCGEKFLLLYNKGLTDAELGKKLNLYTYDIDQLREKYSFRAYGSDKVNIRKSKTIKSKTIKGKQIKGKQIKGNTIKGNTIKGNPPKLLTSKQPLTIEQIIEILKTDNIDVEQEFTKLAMKSPHVDVLRKVDSILNPRDKDLKLDRRTIITKLYGPRVIELHKLGYIQKKIAERVGLYSCFVRYIVDDFQKEQKK
jgi:hypothetical protein